MAKYVDGFLLPVPKKKLAAYRRLAAKAAKVWKKHGALQYFECAGDDIGSKWSTIKFLKAAKAKHGETVVFSFIVYKSKADRDRINAKVMKEFDEIQKKHKNQDMPFDMKRMAYGGFHTLVER